jgi:hypothetical protein
MIQLVIQGIINNNTNYNIRDDTSGNTKDDTSENKRVNAGDDDITDDKFMIKKKQVLSTIVLMLDVITS